MDSEYFFRFLFFFSHLISCINFFYFFFLFSVERGVAATVAPVVVAAVPTAPIATASAAVAAPVAVVTPQKRASPSPALSDTTTVPFPHPSPAISEASTASFNFDGQSPPPEYFAPQFPGSLEQFARRMDQQLRERIRVAAAEARAEIRPYWNPQHMQNREMREERMRAERMREEEIFQANRLRQEAERMREEAERVRVAQMRQAERMQAEQERREQMDDHIQIDRNMPVILLDRDPNRITVRMTRHDFDGYMRYNRVEAHRWRQWVYFNLYCDRLRMGRHEPHLLETALGGNVRVFPMENENNNNNNNNI